MWFETYDNVVATARYLAEERGFETCEIISFLEKPWKWEDEFHAMEAFHAGTLCGECEERPGTLRSEQSYRCDKCQAEIDDEEAGDDPSTEPDEPVTAEAILGAIEEIVR